MADLHTPVVAELERVPDVAAALRSFSDRSDAVLLESARRDSAFGRFSFLAAEPRETVELDNVEYGDAPFARLRQVTQELRCETISGLPPFQGGVIGLLSYDLGRAFERLPQHAVDEFDIPALFAGVYDTVVAWDHLQDRAWVVSHGLDASLRHRDGSLAQQRVSQACDLLRSSGSAESSLEADQEVVPNTVSPDRRYRQALLRPPGLMSSFGRQQYLDVVQRVIDYIHAGDIFQANLSQRLLFPAFCSPLELYCRLRERNPAPFAGFLRHDDWSIASASPERFLRVDGRDVETRPIKGTRRRRPSPEADLLTRDELRESDKDRAENVMIVDLLRNDLSRVCDPGTVNVTKLCAVETYETVQHLVSEVRGRLAIDRDVWDLFTATFPGGSITGAPKVRAMEIIAELEPTARGPYCGSLFYSGFNGQSDSNILIRTFVQRGGWIQCPVGGGVVARSEPDSEYEETLDKAAGMLRALID